MDNERKYSIEEEISPDGSHTFACYDSETDNLTFYAFVPGRCIKEWFRTGHVTDLPLHNPANDFGSKDV